MLEPEDTQNTPQEEQELDRFADLAQQEEDALTGGMGGGDDSPATE